MKRYKHDLSHTQLSSMKMGKLYPVGAIEALPGELHSMDTNVFMRAMPLVAPVMHPCVVRTHRFFVPYRLLWDQWDEFITRQDVDPADPFPLITVPDAGGGAAVRKNLIDYLGINPAAVGSEVSAFDVMAYNLIWNEFYRDQELQTPVALDQTDILRVNWEKDYFTVARPDPQRGDDVLFPLGDRAPVRGIGSTDQTYGSAETVYETDGTGSVNYASASSTGDFRIQQDPNNTGFPNIWADLSQATSATVNQVREAMAMQRILEGFSMYGNRLSEYIQRAFGITPQDARLQRPEYISGGRQMINFSEVLSTAELADYPIGKLAGHGISSGGTRRSKFFVQEHGTILTLVSVRPIPMYVSGCPRKYLRRNFEDFFQPELEAIGQQPVKTGELRLTGTPATDQSTWGWSMRYQEYRQEWNKVTGDFRNVADFQGYHFGRAFPSPQALNSAFLECDPTLDPFADQTDVSDQLMCFTKHHHIKKSVVKPFVKPRIM